MGTYERTYSIYVSYVCTSAQNPDADNVTTYLRRQTLPIDNINFLVGSSKPPEDTDSLGFEAIETASTRSSIWKI